MMNRRHDKVLHMMWQTQVIAALVAPPGRKAEAVRIVRGLMAGRPEAPDAQSGGPGAHTPGPPGDTAVPR